MNFDNAIIEALDPEVARAQNEAGYDIKFLGSFEPAFRNRTTAVWSRCVEGGTILAEDFDTLVARVQEHRNYLGKGHLEEWKTKIYLPQRAAIVFRHGMQTNDFDRLLPYRPAEQTNPSDSKPTDPFDDMKL